MTDSDEPAPPRERPGLHDRGRQPRAGRTDDRARRWPVGAHVGPTDPAVPSAKRRGALRRQRSLVGLAMIIAGLLSITLVLLYRASLRVGAREHGDGLAPRDDSAAASPADVVHEGTFIRLAPSPASTEGEIGNDAHSSPSEPSSSTSPPAKGPSPALDIIRSPAF